MMKPVSFGARSTADHVLAGIDLTGKRYLVTGCNSGIGFETMNALAANGAQVLGLARTLQAAAHACREAGPSCIPVACDLSDLDSVQAAAQWIRQMQVSLDAVVANAAVAHVPVLEVRHGVELQFLVNHVAHFALVNALADLVRDAGRIVIVCGAPSQKLAPPEGIMFDNLDGGRFYRASLFYGQSKLANALYAKELSRRLSGRGIAVNAADPGTTRGTGLYRSCGRWLRAARALSGRLMKSAAQGAATQSLLAASPRVAGISGEYWSNCAVAEADPRCNDPELARRLWVLSEAIVSGHRTAPAPIASLSRAA